jgi:hypothetical protein
MTDFSQAEKEIRKFFAAGWGSTTPIAWPDVPFAPPDNKTWVRVNISGIAGRQVTAGAPGANRFRQNGMVMIQVFQPEGQAGIDGRAKAAAIVDMFQGASTSGGVHFERVYATQVGPDGHGFYQVNVVAFYWHDNLT